ncbi:bucentaur or craniofacial development-domain-containing protein [Truncatella angustata]|uniref:SWR1-complex protein 5 n=1 Tax=Truncatella angustata TaxID=152316 RepID=A0A9P8ZWU1_9PEZI|nr:bucentaur or craniofacial development-domain-containing protein [Truncatella angustata]KAH6654107.1 bucentaur or craniofacial development-domain-containing protein [Truncatella angustata]
MSTEPLIDEEYASEDDSDFAPDETAAGADGIGASDSEDEGEPSAVATAKRKRANEPAGDEGYENSGDEAIISKGKRRQKKKHKGKDGDGVGEDDEGGEGGLVKTRSMRANEKAERKAAAVAGPVTVDVDDLWTKMMAGPIVPSKATAETKTAPQTTEVGDAGRETEDVLSDQVPEKEAPGMIKIKRTYNFAGKVHTEEKLVSRDSAEAKVYLASLGDKAEDALETEEEPAKRQPRKAFRSIFEPVSEGLTQRTDLNLGVTVRLQMREQAKAKKLNVVEKSRMDWAGFVDKEGIQDELKLAGKSKQSFASRQDFLARVEAKRDDDARRARMAGRA